MGKSSNTFDNNRKRAKTMTNTSSSSAEMEDESEEPTLKDLMKLIKESSKRIEDKLDNKVEEVTTRVEKLEKASEVNLKEKKAHNLIVKGVVEEESESLNDLEKKVDQLLVTMDCSGVL